MAKNYNLTFDYVLYEMSMTNIHMYNAVLPSYDSENTKKNEGETINADDPASSKKVDDFFNRINTM